VTEKQKQKKDKKRKLVDWKWGIPLLIGLVGLVVQLAVAPIIGLPESENNMSVKLWMSAEDIPPLNLIYTVSDEGQPRSEYSPSFSYTLRIEQRLILLNPMVWAPSKTYHAPYEGCQLVRVMWCEHIGYRLLNKTALTLWPLTSSFNKKTSSIELIWERSDCGIDEVLLQSQRHENGLRVQVSNHYDYPVQYLGVVKLPPIRTNTLYAIEDSPPTLQASESLVIRTEGNGKTHSEVDFPLVIELPEHMLVTFDIQILEQPPKISLILQAPTLPPPPITPSWIWVMVIIAAIILIAGALLLATTRRKP